MKNFLGAVLLGVGILIAGVSGLCMVIVFASAAMGSSSEELAYLPAVLIFAGVPLALGIGLFFLGRKLIRDANAQSAAGAAGERPATPTPEADDIS